MKAMTTLMAVLMVAGFASANEGAGSAAPAEGHKMEAPATKEAKSEAPKAEKAEKGAAKKKHKKNHEGGEAHQ